MNYNSILLESAELHNKIMEDSLINESNIFAKQYIVLTVKILKSIYETIMALLENIILTITKKVQEILSLPIKETFKEIHYEKVKVKTLINLDKFDIFFVGNQICKIIEVIDENKHNKEIDSILYCHMTGTKVDELPFQTISESIKNFYIYEIPKTQIVTQHEFNNMKSFMLGIDGMSNIELADKIRKLKIKIKKNYKLALAQIDKDFKYMNSQYGIGEETNKKTASETYKKLFDLSMATIGATDFLITKYIYTLTKLANSLYEKHNKKRDSEV